MQHELVNAIVLVCMGRWLLMVNGPNVKPPPAQQPSRSAMQCCQILEVMQRIHAVFWVVNRFQQAVVTVFILSFCS